MEGWCDERIVRDGGGWCWSTEHEYISFTKNCSASIKFMKKKQ